MEWVGSIDVDFAGGLCTRPSTSCTVLMQRQHMTQMLSVTRKVLTLASAESEYHWTGCDAVAGIGLVNFAVNYCCLSWRQLPADATGVIGLADRCGAGLVRRFEMSTFWPWRYITAKTIDVTKTPGLQNWADLGTKHLPWADLAECVKGMGFVFVTGRARSALDIAAGRSSMA